MTITNMNNKRDLSTNFYSIYLTNFEMRIYEMHIIGKYGINCITEYS